MVKFVYQLEQSFRIYMGVTAAVLLPWTISSKAIAQGGQPHGVHPQIVATLMATTGDGQYVLPDYSCEPSFRGGACQDCCLDLWQGYCDTRICKHGCSRMHSGFGCFGCGLGGHLMGRLTCRMGHGACGCETGGCSHGCSTCSSNTGGDYTTQDANAIVPRSSRSRPVTPPVNSVPRNGLPSTSSAPTLPAQPTPPVPRQIDFSPEPSKSNRIPITTASGGENAGTFRLLEQLRTN